MRNNLNLSKVLLILLFLSCGTTNTNPNKNKELLLGTWIIASSNFNKRGSPVPQNATLEFHTNHRVEVTLPNHDENDGDISGLGTWAKSDGFIKIEWDDEKLWGPPRNWKILELTKSKLRWEFEMVDGIQEEVYKRKK